MDARTQEQARQMLANAGRAETAVRAEAWRYRAYLVGQGLVSAGWFVSLAWLSDTESAILASAGVFVVLTAALCIALLPRARASRHGFSKRFSAAMLGWAVVFSVGLAWGLLAWRGVPAYWLTAALLVLLPVLVGAYAEHRSSDDVSP